MNVLSLFDGISGAKVALDNLGIECNYLASEIDPYAIAISRKNHADVYHIGDVRDINFNGVKGINLLIGGSPCQDLSIAKREREGLKGNRSGLFWVYADAVDLLRPDYFILENVASMSDSDKQIITDTLETEPVMLDAADFSAQERKRYFWTNLPVKPVIPKPQTQRDILNLSADRKWITDRIVACGRVEETDYGIRWDTSGKGYWSQQDRAYHIDKQRPTLPAARTITKVNCLFEDGQVGVLNWDEIEKLQSLPVGYTDMGPLNRIEKRGCAIGNGFNVKVVEHILQAI